MKISFFLSLGIVLLTTFGWGFLMEKYGHEEIDNPQDQQIAKYSPGFKRESSAKDSNDKEEYAYSELVDQLRERIKQNKDNKEEIRRIVEEIASLPADDGKKLSTHSLIAILQEDHPALALELWVASNSESILSYEMPDLKKWLRTQTDEALEFYQKSRHSAAMHTGYGSILDPIAYGYARKSPDEAWKWMATLSPREQLAALNGFMEGMLVENAGELGKYLMNIESSAFNKMGLETFVQKFAEADFDAAKSWLLELPDSQQRRYMTRLYAALCNDEEKVKTKMHSLSEQEKPYLVEAMSRHLLNNSSYVEAAAWMHNNKDYYNNNSFNIEALVVKWNFSDGAELRRWIDTLQKDTFRDRVIISYSHENVSDLPGLARLLETVSSTEKGRKNSIKNLVDKWSKTDPGAAQAWVQGANLTEEERKNLEFLEDK